MTVKTADIEETVDSSGQGQGQMLGDEVILKVVLDVEHPYASGVLLRI